MKSFNIDLETVEGIVLAGTMVEIQGAMTVRQDSEPMEGVHHSSLFMNLQKAAQLHGYLSGVLAEAKKRGTI